MNINGKTTWHRTNKWNAFSPSLFLFFILETSFSVVTFQCSHYMFKVSVFVVESREEEKNWTKIQISWKIRKKSISPYSVDKNWLKKKKTHTKKDGGSIWDQFFNGVRPFLWKLSNEQRATITTHKYEQLWNEQLSYRKIINEHKLSEKSHLKYWLLNRAYKIPYKIHNAYHLQYIIRKETAWWKPERATASQPTNSMQFDGGKLQISDYKILTSISHFPNFDCAIFTFITI